MTRLLRAESTSALALVALIALCSAGAVRSQTVVTPYIPRAMASNGAVVMMPEIAGMDCPEIEHVLRRIDLSKYRSPGPIPVGHPDWPIFEYEDELAVRYYRSCIMAANPLEDPGSAFSLGFESQ